MQLDVRGVPVRLVLRRDDYIHDVLRELTLLPSDADARRSRAEVDALVNTRATLHLLLDRSPALGLGDRSAADAAFERGDETIAMTIDGPDEATRALRLWREIIVVLAGLESPFASPPAPALVTFHEEWLDELTRLLGGGAASATSFPRSWAALAEAGWLERAAPLEVPVAAPTADAGAMTAERGVARAAKEVSGARRWLVETVTDWGTPEIAEEACLPLTEVLTNALLHARGELTVFLRLHAGRLRVEVCDGSAAGLVHRGHALESMTGRGLELVGMIADRWGVMPDGEGKRVWFELAPAAERAEAM